MLTGSGGIAAEPAAPESGEIHYKIEWKGLKKHPQEKALKEVSRIESLKELSIPSIPLLRKRLDEDLLRLTSFLQAKGYYLAEVQGQYDSSSVPGVVRFQCNPGPLFTIGEQTFTYRGDTVPHKKWQPYINGSDPATTQVILNSEKYMLRHFQNTGHPFPQILTRNYVLDPERKKMDLNYEIDPGPIMRMGKVTIQGLESVGEKSILRQINWKPGDLYDLRLLEEFEKELILTGLFSRVKLTPAPSETEAPQIDFTLAVTERYHRTFRFGVDHRSDVGFGMKTSWEHRNYFGKGEKLRLDFTLAEEETIAGIVIRKPGFQIRNQSLVLGLTASEERPDAYTSQSLESYVGLEREYNRRFANSIGIAYKYATVEQGGDEDLYGLLSLPLQSVWDTTANDLHPSKGHRLISQATPYTDLLNQDLTFGRLQVIGSKYHIIHKRPQLVLAGRVAVGSLLGAEVDDIPADERFYAGGGGSVRGFSYQSIGPKEDGESIGGSSLLEVSAELRARFTETWGLATFLDGGMVTNEKAPFGNQPLQWGAGAGLRIFTGIGPLRLDLAYPINPDEDQESRLQFYISLGQSF